MTKHTLIVPKTISYSESYTLNLGNYTTTRIQYGIEVPVYTQTKFKKIKDQVIKEVHAAVVKRVKELQEEYSPENIIDLEEI